MVRVGPHGGINARRLPEVRFTHRADRWAGCDGRRRGGGGDGLPGGRSPFGRFDRGEARIANARRGSGFIGSRTASLRVHAPRRAVRSDSSATIDSAPCLPRGFIVTPGRSEQQLMRAGASFLETPALFLLWPIRSRNARLIRAITSRSASTYHVTPDRQNRGAHRCVPTEL